MATPLYPMGVCGALYAEVVTPNITSLTIIETWRREYNEERPKKALGGLTPAAYARHLAERSATVAAGL